MTFDQDAPARASRDGSNLPYRSVQSRFAGLPSYIFGLHDPGGEVQMLAAGKPGWVVISCQLNPPDSDGDFSALAEKGLGVIVRLNNGYGSAGTIPPSDQHDRFAFRCAQFVARSSGARVWIIGNSPNSPTERPGNDGTDGSGEIITPETYARCFIKCRKAIRALPRHENDWVLPAAVAPFATQTTYPNNPSGDWVRYFADMIFQIHLQGGALDGIALHAYTHGPEAELVTSDARAAGDFVERHWHFRSYRDFLGAVPPALRSLPVLITEALPLEPGWTRQDRTWIRTACAEIDSWNGNQANQPVQAICFFRWQSRAGDPPGWGMAEKWEVVHDFTAALRYDRRVRWPGVQPKPDYLVEWIGTPEIPGSTLTVDAVATGRAVFMNAGAKAWLSTGTNAVRLVYRWYDSAGAEIPLNPKAEQYRLPQNVLPGQTAEIDQVRLRAPSRPGHHLLRFDLLHGDDYWFGNCDSPTRDLTIAVTPPPHAVEWEHVVELIDNTIETNADVAGTVTVKNIGSAAWPMGGDYPVVLAYQWIDANDDEVKLEEYPGPFFLKADTAPGKIGEFESVHVRAPRTEGAFYLIWDLVQEGITLFSAKGAATLRQQIAVNAPPPEFAINWLKVFEIPREVEPNEEIGGRISVQNAGTRIWNANGSSPVKLAIQWHDHQGKLVPGELYSKLFPLSNDVPSGSVADITVQINAPVPRGEYTLSVDLAKEGVAFYSDSGRPPKTTVTVRPLAPEYSADWVETISIPDNSLRVGDILHGRIQVKNSGSAPWTRIGENPIKLGYRWFDQSGQEVSPFGNTFQLTQDVLPREFAVLEGLYLQAPTIPGEYTIIWSMYREGYGWILRDDNQDPCASVSIKPPPLEWGAEFVAHNTPTSLSVGQQTTVDLLVKNVGKNVWGTGGGNSVYARYNWINGAEGPQYAAAAHLARLQSETPPGEMAEFAATLEAPPSPGSFRLEWDLGVEGARWFSDEGNPPLAVPVIVTATPGETNLWRAEASHSRASAMYAIDGDLGSAWSSLTPQAPGMWFRVTFGEPRVIDGIAFRSPGRGHPSGYAVRISSDGRTWRTISSAPHGNMRDIVQSFAPQPVLCSQVELLARSADSWSIGEVQIHRGELWSATASQNGTIARNAIDNNSATAWTSGQPQSPDMWFQLDLGRIESISGLRMVPPGDENPAGFRVTVWNDQSGRWQNVAERHNNLENVDVSFAPVQTQYISVQLSIASVKPWAIREIQVDRAMTKWVGPSGSN